jgi:hypothetical protein
MPTNGEDNDMCMYVGTEVMYVMPSQTTMCDTFDQTELHHEIFSALASTQCSAIASSHSSVISYLLIRWPSLRNYQLSLDT